jgi:hypothetical protein
LRVGDRRSLPLFDPQPTKGIRMRTKHEKLRETRKPQKNYKNNKHIFKLELCLDEGDSFRGKGKQTNKFSFQVNYLINNFLE